MRRARLIVVSCALATAMLTGTAPARSDAVTIRTHRPDGHLRLRALHVDPTDRVIVDSEDRQVTLRGVNVNALGDYYRANRDLPTVIALDGTDWDRMAEHGFNVVRLLISWSRLEPTRGVVDWEYLDVIERTVDAAARRGIYSIIDMHQDAWGKFIATPEGATCAAGSRPAIGWDGAPEWATIIGDADTCRTGGREDTPAVRAAWDAFYDDAHEIQSHLVAMWFFVALRFADNPAVAGYDLLNEPNHGNRADFAERLGAYYGRAIDAIRTAELVARATRHGSFAHIVVFEPTVSGVPVPPEFSSDPNRVFGPHNYGESISSIPLEATFDYFDALAQSYGTPLWVGEYGWFNDPTADQQTLARYAAKEDALLTSGSAWWQWKQACGDPHSVGSPGATVTGPILQMRANGCPGDVDLGIIAERACTWRPYPTAVPGRLVAMRSACSGAVVFSGTTDRPGWAEVWSPGARAPEVHGTTATVARRRVRGGWLVRAAVSGDYALSVAPATGQHGATLVRGS